MEERSMQLKNLEEYRFLVGFHQQVQKECKKAWHNRHIKMRTFKVNDLVLLYDSKFDKFLGKFHMHWLRPYAIKEITDGGAVQLVKLNGDPFPRKINVSQLKSYTRDLARLLYDGSTVLALQVAERRRETINYTAWVVGLHDWVTVRDGIMS